MDNYPVPPNNREADQRLGRLSLLSLLLASLSGQDRYARVVAASLSALGELVRRGDASGSAFEPTRKEHAAHLCVTVLGKVFVVFLVLFIFPFRCLCDLVGGCKKSTVGYHTKDCEV